ncbi:XisI protein [uncultured Fibrella sp.]|uniref:XisI protein n=1 Tax=uncultured Fibrella sp. TaxID=1284596 RepID=UPI0035CA8156
MRVGWLKNHRVHGASLHLDIIGDKIWIQRDGTDRPIADELVEAGVPKEDIVLAFYPENMRAYTGFAVR